MKYDYVTHLLVGYIGATVVKLGLPNLAVFNFFLGTPDLSVYTGQFYVVPQQSIPQQSVQPSDRKLLSWKAGCSGKHLSWCQFGNTWGTGAAGTSNSFVNLHDLFTQTLWWLSDSHSGAHFSFANANDLLERSTAKWDTPARIDV